MPQDTSSISSIPGLENDPDGARIVGEELRLLEVVRRAATKSAPGASEEEQKLDDARLLELRDDVAAAKPEDLPALFEQMHTLAALRDQRGRGQPRFLDVKSPYFAHLRLDEKEARRDVLIGNQSYIDSRAGVRIVDWRHAPVSRIYYRYTEGDDYEESFGGRLVEGRVALRRSVAIENGVLRRVTAPQGTFVMGTGGTWRRLEARAARLRTREARKAAPLEAGPKTLPAIAAMLDPAQFELVTRPGTSLIAIQGSAGSGKTTVGLHRVAYLAFVDPARFKADRMLVVMPNDALAHYVARVLPSLGVDGVPVVTFAAWSRRLLLELLPKLTHHVSDETPPVVARAKGHARMLAALEICARDLTSHLDTRVRAAMEKWPDGADVVRAWENTAKVTHAPDARVVLLTEWLAGKRGIPECERASRLHVTTRGALERACHELRKESRDVLAIWDEATTSREVLDQAFAGEADMSPGHLDQVHAWCVRQARTAREGDRDGDAPWLDVEDRALILRAWQLVRGPLLDARGHPLRVAHLFVDEVEDMTPIELRVLLELAGKERSVTFAGDVAQRLFEANPRHAQIPSEQPEFEWNRLFADIGLAGDAEAKAIEPLRVSYRSTAQITRFAKGILGPLAHDVDPILGRDGPDVELFQFASAGEAVAFLADTLREVALADPEALIALIARHPEQADIYYEGLARAEVPNLRRVANLDFSWEPGVDVTDVRQTKGLEFDEVVLLETTRTTYPTNTPARHALYVAATRAAHQLWCVASEAPSELVTGALAAR